MLPIRFVRAMAAAAWAVSQAPTTEVTTMNPRPFCAFLLGSSLFLTAAAAATAPTIQLIVPTFDYPGVEYLDTTAFAMANNGTVVGSVRSGPGDLLYEHFPDGGFSTPVGFPGHPPPTLSG